LLPALDLLDARASATDLLFARDSLLANYELDRSDEISTLVSDLARLTAQVEQSKDQLDRLSLVSPTAGVVNTIYTTTIGGVVQSGEPIFEITPLNDELLVEVRVQPKDIAFVTNDMSATIKLSAYDYTIHGTLSGRISQISADTFEDNQNAEQEPYYKVLIALDPIALSERSDVFDVRPGMLADAEVHVGERTVMQYFLKPLIKSQDALREP
jgi:adhesin transport system membrane fusion protein